MRYALIVFLFIVGCNSYEKKPSVVEQYNHKTIYVYVFNDDTQLWNRARADTLQKADCGKIRLLVSEPEDRMDKVIK